MARFSARSVAPVLRTSAHSDRVAATFRRLAAWPLAWLAAIFCALFVLAIVQAVVTAASDHELNQDQWFGIPVARIAQLAGAVAVVIGRRYVLVATESVAKPIFPRPARSEWRGYARGLGVAYAFAGAGAWAITWTTIALVAYNIVKLWPDAPPLSDFVLTIPLFTGALVLLVWAYFVGRNERMRQLESATPPTLRQAHELHDRAEALEDAMQKATVMADELQRIIDAEKRLITDLLSESAEARRIVEIESGQLNALLAHQEKQQRRSIRRERWINIAVAAVSLVLGYLLNLVSPDFFANVIHR